MIEVMNCPRCNRPPEISLKKVGVSQFCSIHCTLLGCKYYCPIVRTGFSQTQAHDKAAKRWNQLVVEGKGTVDG